MLTPFQNRGNGEARYCIAVAVTNNAVRLLLLSETPVTNDARSTGFDRVRETHLRHAVIQTRVTRVTVWSHVGRAV